MERKNFNNEIKNFRKKIWFLNRQLKVLHIISGLKSGGAEGVLYRLILNDNKNEHYVLSLTNEGFYGHLLKKKNLC